MSTDAVPRQCIATILVDSRSCQSGESCEQIYEQSACTWTMESWKAGLPRIPVTQCDLKWAVEIDTISCESIMQTAWLDRLTPRNIDAL